MNELFRIKIEIKINYILPSQVILLSIKINSMRQNRVICIEIYLLLSKFDSGISIPNALTIKAAQSILHTSFSIFEFGLIPTLRTAENTLT